MTITTDQTYVWPPNFVEGTDTMGKNTRRIAVRISGSSDAASDETVTLIDKSDLLGPEGAEPSGLTVECVEWSMQGIDYVTLQFDHTTDDQIMLLSGTGEVDYTSMGGIADPQSAGGTGDITATTSQAGNGGDFEIYLKCRLNP